MAQTTPLFHSKVTRNYEPLVSDQVSYDGANKSWDISICGQDNQIKPGSITESEKNIFPHFGIAHHPASSSICAAAFCPRVKQSECVDDHSTPPNNDLKNEWRSPTSRYLVFVCIHSLIQRPDNDLITDPALQSVSMSFISGNLNILSGGRGIL